MLLFRSEEHLDSWTEARGAGTGGVLTPDQGWRLARAWFHDRLSEGWRRKTAGESQAVFEAIGLAGPFWRLPDVSSAPPPDTPEA